jgi:DNA-binding NarL/FixJ family response regulator
MPNSPTLIRIVIYEDNATLRQALVMLLTGIDGFVVIGAFADCLMAAEQTQQLRPDVILMDIDMPGRDGITATTEIHQKHPAVEILMLTIFDDDDRVFQALCAGASGYLLKQTPPIDILAAIQDVYNGGSPMSPAIARKVIRAFADKPKPKNTALLLLSDRERQVLTELSKGMGYKSVANELKISVETVRTHIKRIYEKLQVHSVIEAVNKTR